MIAAGSEARFIRAMLEPVCPVPFVAWPAYGLPGWVGALDLVVVMASEASSPALVATVHEAVRRGAQLLIACPPASTIAEHAGSSSTILLPTATADPLAAAIVCWPPCTDAARAGGRPAAVADAMDQVAEDCSPFADVAENPAKDLAIGAGRGAAAGLGRLGAGGPGQPPGRRGAARRQRPGRAGRRRRRAAPGAGVGRAPRPVRRPLRGRGLGRPAPGPGDPGRRQPGVADPHRRGAAEGRRRTQRHPGLRHRSTRSGSDVERYAALLQTGMYTAVYLAVGLGRYLAS